MEKIIQDLEEVNKEIYYKFGTESYEIRCKLYDIRIALKKRNERWKIFNYIIKGKRKL